MNYSWPGNVRELQNVIERALILNPKGPLTFENLHPYRVSNSEQFAINNETSNKISTDNLDEVIVQHIRAILSKTKGKINGPKGAAATLGINPSTLRNRMKKLGMI